MKTGVLLVNLGTPDRPDVPAVRRYLAEFLSDERVLDMHPVARALLLYGVILPFRPKRSAAAYQKVWDEERGSPLLFHSQDLAAGLQEALGQGHEVRLAMRYGQPDLPSALEALEAAGCGRLLWALGTAATSQRCARRCHGRDLAAFRSAAPGAAGCSGGAESPGAPGATGGCSEGA